MNSMFWKKSKKKEKQESELIGKEVIYDTEMGNKREGKIFKEEMLSVYIKDSETDSVVIKKAGDYKLK